MSTWRVLISSWVLSLSLLFCSALIVDEPAAGHLLYYTMIHTAHLNAEQDDLDVDSGGAQSASESIKLICLPYIIIPCLLLTHALLTSTLGRLMRMSWSVVSCKAFRCGEKNTTTVCANETRNIFLKTTVRYLTRLLADFVFRACLMREINP